ncbi:MAG: hypothetical protein J0H68_04260 [Sphingobacteriia bacterium]|nr:hypothetical protein [Sphingobacteriia bacterium]
MTKETYSVEINLKEFWNSKVFDATIKDSNENVFEFRIENKTGNAINLLSYWFSSPAPLTITDENKVVTNIKPFYDPVWERLGTVKLTCNFDDFNDKPKLQNVIKVCNKSMIDLDIDPNTTKEWGFFESDYYLQKTYEFDNADTRYDLYHPMVGYNCHIIDPNEYINS